MTHVADRPSLPMAITMGDASGVGPELVLRRAAAWLASGDTAIDDVVVYGDLEILRHGAGLLGLDLPLVAVQPGARHTGVLQVMDLALLTAADHRPGRLDGASPVTALERQCPPADTYPRRAPATRTRRPPRPECLAGHPCPPETGADGLLAQSTLTLYSPRRGTADPA